MTVPFRPSDPLTHVVVSSNFLVMAMNNNLLLRLDLEHPDQQEGLPVYTQMDTVNNYYLLVKFNCLKSTVWSKKANEQIDVPQHIMSA